MCREKKEEQRQEEEDADQQAADNFDALMEREQHDMESQDEDLKSHYRELPDDIQTEDEKHP